jgi:hypothetical protein
MEFKPLPLQTNFCMLLSIKTCLWSFLFILFPVKASLYLDIDVESDLVDGFNASTDQDVRYNCLLRLAELGHCATFIKLVPTELALVNKFIHTLIVKHCDYGTFEKLIDLMNIPAESKAATEVEMVERVLEQSLNNRIYPDVFERLYNLLIFHGAENRFTYRINELLKMAFEKGHLEAVTFLSEHCPVDIQRIMPEFILIDAVSMQYRSLVKYWVDNYGFNDKRMPLFVRTGMLPLLEDLHTICPQLQFSDITQSQCIDTAASFNHFKLVRRFSGCRENYLREALRILYTDSAMNSCKTTSKRVQLVLTLLTLINRLDEIPDFIENPEQASLLTRTALDIFRGNIRGYLDPNDLHYVDVLAILMAITEFDLPKSEKMFLEAVPDLMDAEFVEDAIVTDGSVNIMTISVYSKDLWKKILRETVCDSGLPRKAIKELFEFEEEFDMPSAYTDNSV